MFPTSSQLKHWTFSGNTEIGKLRLNANQSFIAEHGQDISVSVTLQTLLLILLKTKHIFIKKKLLDAHFLDFGIQISREFNHSMNVGEGKINVACNLLVAGH